MKILTRLRECAGWSNFRWTHMSKAKFSGPSCSKLTMLLVNDSLKFTSSDKQTCWNFLLKNVSSFCRAKATHIFSAKNISILYIESAKTFNEMPLNELVKLMTLWTTGPWCCSDLRITVTNVKSKDQTVEILKQTDLKLGYLWSVGKDPFPWPQKVGRLLPVVSV